MSKPKKNVPKPDNEVSGNGRPRYNRIKAVMAEKNISNKELARRVKKTPGTVSNWCTNFKQPNIETLFEIARAIGVEPSTLINTLDNAGA